MNEIEKEVLVCVHCQEEVEATDQFCPRCGILFEEEKVCANHHGVEAKGVCLICAEPLCDKCGGWVNDRFLCKQHERYEITEKRIHRKNSESFFR